MDRNFDRAHIDRSTGTSIRIEDEDSGRVRPRNFGQRSGESNLSSVAVRTEAGSFGQDRADFGVGVDEGSGPSFGQLQGCSVRATETQGRAGEAEVSIGQPEVLGADPRIGAGRATETSDCPTETSDRCAEWARRSAAAQCFGIDPENEPRDEVKILTFFNKMRL